MSNHRRAVPGQGAYLESPEYAFISTILWFSRWSERFLAPHFGKLSGVHGHVLARLRETPGLPQNELAAKIHRDAPSTSRIIDEMSKMGLIERRIDPEDRRRRRLYMTKKAARLHLKIEQAFVNERKKAGIELAPADVEALWRVARVLQDRYRAALEEADQDASRRPTRVGGARAGTRTRR